MSDKEDSYVPQVEIDGEMYHETATVWFSVDKETKTEDVGGNTKTTRFYRLKKGVVVRDKIRSEKVIREEEGSRGKLVILNQLDIEVKKEMKRLEEIK